jgi:transposase
VTLYPTERNEFLLDGHRRAFEFFQGVPHRVIYDTIQARATRKALSKAL